MKPSSRQVRPPEQRRFFIRGGSFMSSSPAPEPSGGSKFWVVFLLGVPVLTAVIYFVWRAMQPGEVDLLVVMQANNRGVGHMDQYDFAKAVKEFEEVVRLAP